MVTSYFYKVTFPTLLQSDDELKTDCESAILLCTFYFHISFLNKSIHSLYMNYYFDIFSNIGICTYILLCPELISSEIKLKK